MSEEEVYRIHVEKSTERVKISRKNNNKSIYLIVDKVGPSVSFNLEKGDNRQGCCNDFVFIDSKPQMMEDMGRLIAKAGEVAKKYKEEKE